MPKMFKKSPSKTFPILPKLQIGPNITVVKEGWLNMKVVGALRTIKNWRPEYFYLLVDGAFLGYENIPANFGTTPPSHNFTVKGCQYMICEKPKPYTFALRGLDPNKTIERTFYVDSDQDRQEWVKAIEKVKESLTENSSVNFSPDVPDPAQEPCCSSSSSFVSHEPDWTVNDQELFNKFKVQDALQDEQSGKKKVTFDNFEFLVLLGKGAFGKVILCREKISGKLYALKTMRKQVIIKKDLDVDHTLTEKRVLQRTNHPFIISLKCSFQSNDKLCFVTEYVNGGDMFFHLQQAPNKRFSEEKTRFYAAEIISAVGYLHKKEIIYRDLKPENILLDKYGHVKIVDLGLCKEKITYGRTTRTFCGSQYYLAPEVVTRKPYSLAVDWWGLGVVMYEMLFRDPPFCHQDKDSLFDLIATGELKFPPHISVSDEALDLLKGLLKKNPYERLGGGPDDAQPVMRHPFFGSINWDDLYNKKMDPPFIPKVTSDTDTRYFDIAFTGQSVELTPPASNENSDEDDDVDEFESFSYKGVSATPPLDDKTLID